MVDDSEPVDADTSGFERIAEGEGNGAAAHPRGLRRGGASPRRRFDAHCSCYTNPAHNGSCRGSSRGLLSVLVDGAFYLQLASLGDQLAKPSPTGPGEDESAFAPETFDGGVS